jgi:hypothetical protein
MREKEAGIEMGGVKGMAAPELRHRHVLLDLGRSTQCTTTRRRPRIRRGGRHHERQGSRGRWSTWDVAA